MAKLYCNVHLYKLTLFYGLYAALVMHGYVLTILIGNSWQAGSEEVNVAGSEEVNMAGRQ